MSLPPLPRLLLVVGVLCAGDLAGPCAHRAAHADDDATMRVAKKAFERAEKLFALGKFDEALAQYQRAYDAKPLPGLLFNIGQCHRNLGDYEAAIFSFKKYLKAAPGSDNREQVEEYIVDLEAEQEKANAQRFRLIDREQRRDEPPPPPTASPIYTRWWFWTGIVVVGAAGGVGLYAATRPDGAPATDLGNIVFTR